MKVYAYHIKENFQKLKYFLINNEQKQIDRSDLVILSTDHKYWTLILMHSLTNLRKLVLENRRGNTTHYYASSMLV